MSGQLVHMAAQEHASEMRRHGAANAAAAELRAGRGHSLRLPRMRARMRRDCR